MQEIISFANLCLPSTEKLTTRKIRKVFDRGLSERYLDRVILVGTKNIENAVLILTKFKLGGAVQGLGGASRIEVP